MRQGSRGFSMVELMVMFAVMAVVIVPVTSLFTSSVKTSRVSDSIYASIGIGSSILESLRDVDREKLKEIPATDISEAPEPFGASGLGVRYDAARFRPVISSEEIAGPAGMRAFIVSVEVERLAEQGSKGHRLTALLLGPAPGESEE